MHESVMSFVSVYTKHLNEENCVVCCFVCGTVAGYRLSGFKCLYKKKKNTKNIQWVGNALHMRGQLADCCNHKRKSI